MGKARKLGINIPYIMEVDTEIKTITMQFVDGLKLKDFLN
jgi:tRNA A-37 threonylcarbamoyl transferase component Bud32